VRAARAAVERIEAFTSVLEKDPSSAAGPVYEECKRHSPEDAAGWKLLASVDRELVPYRGYCFAPEGFGRPQERRQTLKAEPTYVMVLLARLIPLAAAGMQGPIATAQAKRGGGPRSPSTPPPMDGRSPTCGRGSCRYP
jgi:hypothetical protein